MSFGVLKNFHPMIGYDLHVVMPPGSPTPGPPGPHVAMSSLMGIGATAQMGPMETTHWGFTMFRGTDIGPLIPHAPLVPNCLLPLILATSASKSHFGSSQHLVEGKPAATACLMIANLNLNCADPCPMPLDGVAALTGHFVGMSLGDWLSGWVHMAVDVGLAYAINKFGSWAFSGLSQRLYETVLFRPMMAAFERMGYGTVCSWLLRNDFQEMMAKGLTAKLGQIIAGDFLGSPLGYSFPINAWGAADSYGGKAAGGDDRGAMEDTHDALQRYIDGPGAESHNVPPTVDSGAEGAPNAPADAGAAADGGAGGAPGVGSPPAGGASGPPDAAASAGTGGASSGGSGGADGAGPRGDSATTAGDTSAGSAPNAGPSASAGASDGSDNQCLPGGPDGPGGDD